MKIVIDNRIIASLFAMIVFVPVLYITFHDWSGEPQSTLERIMKTGKIRLLTDNNANTYYIYRGQSMGVEYEMAKQFADYLGVELEIITPGWNNLIPYLQQGKGDFIGAGLTITPEREKRVDFSMPYMSVQQKIIHHKMVFDVGKIEELKGKTLHVRRGTSYQARLEELQKNGIGLHIKLYDNVPTEELIRKVAERQINFTVADSNIALLNRRYYPDIRIGMPIQDEEFLAWAIRKNDSEFLEKMDGFFQDIEKNGILAKIYEKYYGAVEVFDYFDLKKFHQRIKTRLPKYLPVIKQESAKADLDWRLVAAQIYQESHFLPEAKSHTGVKGLMQVTLATAEEMGISDRLDPHQSLRAGIRYLKKMFERFDDIEGRHQRMLFALGSYNIGYGHIRDAQKLAAQQGLDPRKWSSMKKVLPNLMKRRYYTKTKHGYARGWEAVRYVDRILTYYDILKQKV